MTQKNSHPIWTKDGEQIKKRGYSHKGWYIIQGQVTTMGLDAALLKSGPVIRAFLADVPAVPCW